MDDLINNLTNEVINLKFPNNTSRKNIFQEGDNGYQGFVAGYIRTRFSGRNTRGYSLRLKDIPKRCNQSYILAKELCEKELPDFKFTSIQFNKNYKIAKHIDKFNTGKSYIIGLGDYEGGELLIYFNGKDEPPTPIDIKNKFYTFAGHKYYHEVAEFTGNRISLVYYNIEKPQDIYYENFINYINDKNHIICILAKNCDCNLDQRLDNYKDQENKIIIFCENREIFDNYKKTIDKNKYYKILFKDRKKFTLSEYIRFILPDNTFIIYDN